MYVHVLLTSNHRGRSRSDRPFHLQESRGVINSTGAFLHCFSPRAPVLATEGLVQDTVGMFEALIEYDLTDSDT